MYSDGRGRSVRRTHVCRAMPEATPALIDRVEPYMAIEHTIDAASRASSDRPGPSWPNTSRLRRGSCTDSRGTAPSRLSIPTTCRSAASAWPTSSTTLEWCSTCRYRSVTIAPRRFQRRRPTMCTRRTPNAFALRTTVPMLKSCSQFSIATSTGNGVAVEVRPDRLDGPVPIAVDHVAAVAVLEQFGVEPLVLGPRPAGGVRHRLLAGSSVGPCVGSALGLPALSLTGADRSVWAMPDLPTARVTLLVAHGSRNPLASRSARTAVPGRRRQVERRRRTRGRGAARLPGAGRAVDPRRDRRRRRRRCDAAPGAPALPRPRQPRLGRHPRDRRRRPPAPPGRRPSSSPSTSVPTRRWSTCSPPASWPEHTRRSAPRRRRVVIRPGARVTVTRLDRRQMPMRCASSSRWYVGSPKSSSELLARLKYRCAGCSQVKPMPPWIWMFSAAAWKYASEQ